MSKAHGVLIVFLLIMSTFLLTKWRAGIMLSAPVVSNQVLDSLDVKAKINSRFRLEEVSVDDFHGLDIGYMVVGKINGIDGWGGSLTSVSAWDRKTLGDSNLQIIKKLGQEMQNHGVQRMVKEPSTTIFYDAYQNCYLRSKYKNTTDSRYVKQMKETHSRWGKRGEWQIYVHRYSFQRYLAENSHE